MFHISSLTPLKNLILLWEVPLAIIYFLISKNPVLKLTYSFRGD